MGILCQGVPRHGNYARERLVRILTDPERPVQLIVAGKAHPEDKVGKHLVQAWAEFEQQPKVRNHVVFLEDYDIVLAQELVQGVDVWINKPRGRGGLRHQRHERDSCFLQRSQ